jgi:hypothetical protein
MPNHNAKRTVTLSAVTILFVCALSVCPKANSGHSALHKFWRVFETAQHHDALRLTPLPVRFVLLTQRRLSTWRSIQSLQSY